MLRACRLAAIAFVSTLALGCGESDIDGPRPRSEAATTAGTGGGGGGPAPTPAVEIRQPGTGALLSEALWGEPFEVHVVGLGPGATTIVRGQLPNYRSEATFVADDAGEIDTAVQAPLDGTYDEADADGLVWSMRIVDAGDTAVHDLSVVAFEAEVDGAVVASASLTRYRQAQGVEVGTIDDEAIVGVYYTPPGPGPHPAILVFGGSEGGTSYVEKRAPYLASLGYATLGVGYFAASGLPKNLGKVPLEYFGHALDWLGARPEVDPARVAVMGGSRGGELALLLGATFPDRIAAVVALVPSGLRWPGFDGVGTAAAWTLDGDPLGYMTKYGTGKNVIGPGGETLYASTPAFEQGVALSTADELAAATTLVEATQAPILMVGGGDDQLWPSCQLSQVAVDRLTAAQHAATWADDYVCYPGSGHFVSSLPGVPTTDQYKSYHPVFKKWFALGGEPRSQAHAQRDLVERLKAFLGAALAPR